MDQPSTAITTTRLLKVKLLQITATANTLKCVAIAMLIGMRNNFFLVVQF